MNNHIVKEWIGACKKGIRSGFFKRYPLDDRLYRLFSVACCREVWSKLSNEQSRKAVETAELFADGLTTEEELIKARNDAWNIDSPDWASVHAANTNCTSLYVAIDVSVLSTYSTTEFYKQSLIIAQMYPTTFNNNYINPTTTALAKQIYDNRDFSLMPILADALQDVNCTEDILEHLRSKGPFYKGNYIIDVLTGKRTT